MYLAKQVTFRWCSTQARDLRYFPHPYQTSVDFLCQNNHLVHFLALVYGPDKLHVLDVYSGHIGQWLVKMQCTSSVTTCCMPCSIWDCYNNIHSGQFWEVLYFSKRLRLLLTKVFLSSCPLNILLLTTLTSGPNLCMIAAENAAPANNRR